MSRRKWTIEELDLLHQLYPHTITREISFQVQHSLSSVYGKAKELGLKKSPEFHLSEASGRITPGSKLGASFRFMPGNSPANKGLKMSAEVRAKAEPTMFKKGDLPHNTKKDGDITIRADKRGIFYQFIRISNGKWESLHRWNWMQAHGPIPKGMNLIFKDRNTLNAELNNLELLTDAELMQRNTIHNYPEDLKEVLRLTAKIKRKIKQHGEK